MILQLVREARRIVGRGDRQAEWRGVARLLEVVQLLVIVDIEVITGQLADLLQGVEQGAPLEYHLGEFDAPRLDEGARVNLREVLCEESLDHPQVCVVLH